MDLGIILVLALIFIPLLLMTSPTWPWHKSISGITANDVFTRNGRYQGVFGFNYPTGPHYGVGSKKYKRSDERILDEIHDRLMFHGEIDAKDIEVTVKNGDVWLFGSVPTKRMRRGAEDIAELVVGVRNVDNELTVGTNHKHDHDLEVEQAIHYHDRSYAEDPGSVTHH